VTYKKGLFSCRSLQHFVCEHSRIFFWKQNAWETYKKRDPYHFVENDLQLHFSFQEWKGLFSWVWTEKNAWVCTNKMLERPTRKETHKKDLLLSYVSCDKRDIYTWKWHVKRDIYIWKGHLSLLSHQTYGVATISRLLNIIGLFCKRDIYTCKWHVKRDIYIWKGYLSLLTHQTYGVATISRLLTIIGLFCRI